MIDRAEDIGFGELALSSFVSIGDEKVQNHNQELPDDKEVITSIHLNLGRFYDNVTNKESNKTLGGNLGEIREIMNKLGVPDRHEDEVRLALISRIEEFRDKAQAVQLPVKPVRDYNHHKESIIEYLKAGDGVGQWTEINALNKPLLRKLAPKAYKAIVAWEAKPDNSLASVGLSIPGKSEMLASAQVPPDILKAAQRVVTRANRAKAAHIKFSNGD